MMVNFENHPCFNDKVRHKYARIHLPVAPRCNIQCNFCNRDFDCVNESRPGVTSGILSPKQAILYLDSVVERMPNLSVVGIAGPGDPFANPEETMETLRLVRAKYPEMLLCVASNGLNIIPYIPELAELKVSHVTITVNAVNSDVSSEIYSWVRYNKRIYNNIDGAKLLLQNQLEAIRKLKEYDITVKINSIIIPGKNTHHIPLLAEMMKELGADILNCIPLIPTKNTVFENVLEPTHNEVKRIRNEAEKFLPQMSHCRRCRADAVGLLGEEVTDKIVNDIRSFSELNETDIEFMNNVTSVRPYVAVASMEGVLVNQHLGEAERLLIYRRNGGSSDLVESRDTPLAGSGDERWKSLGKVLNDCNSIIVSGIGNKPKEILENSGLKTFVMEGLISEAVEGIFYGRNVNHLIKRCKTVCGQSCSGNSMGCG